MSRRKKLKKTTPEVEPADYLPTPAVIPEDLSPQDWMPISTMGWTFVTAAAEEAGGKPMLGGWLLERGVPRAWSIRGPIPYDKGGPLLQAWHDWFDDKDGSWERFLECSTRWINEYGQPPEGKGSSYLPMLLQATEDRNPELVAIAFFLYLGALDAEREVLA